MIGFASVKGAPGVTSAALAIAAVWPRPCVLLEADPSGGDVVYRARPASGAAVLPGRGLVQLAAAVRGGVDPTGAEVMGQAQPLACGVSLVQGVTSAAQARGLSGLWTTIALACRRAEVDVIVDLGRLDRMSPVLPIAQQCDVLLPVTTATLDSAMHLAESIGDLSGALAAHKAVTLRPLVVGPDESGARDCADLDELLDRRGTPAAPAMPVPHDPRALVRLESGEEPTGRLGRTLLIRAAVAIASQLSTGSVRGAA